METASCTAARTPGGSLTRASKKRAATEASPATSCGARPASWPTACDRVVFRDLSGFVFGKLWFFGMWSHSGVLRGVSAVKLKQEGW